MNERKVGWLLKVTCRIEEGFCSHSEAVEHIYVFKAELEEREVGGNWRQSAN